MTWDGKPALGPDWWEEWETQNGAFGIGYDGRESDDVETVEKGLKGSIVLGAGDGDVVAIPVPLRHALAALCLKDQEFGFIHQDLHTIAEAVELTDLTGDGDLRERLEEVAARIAALLPPEAK